MFQILIHLRAGGDKNNSTKIGLFLLVIFLSFLLRQPVLAQTPSEISGVVFQDLNINSQLDIAEVKLADWQVNLYQDNKLIKSIKTNSAGKYDIIDLNSGKYEVELSVPEGWVAVNDQKVIINLKPGEKVKVNFANYQMVSQPVQLGPMMNIHTISVSSLSANSVKIAWFTNYAATGQVVFGSESKTANYLVSGSNNFGYPFSSGVDFQTTTYHSLILTGLKPQTTYYYRVSSLPDPKQWHGALRLISDEFSFKTPAQAFEKKQDIPNVLKGKILATTYQEKAQGNSPTTTPVNEAIKNITSGLPGQCPFYIWPMLILNLFLIVFVWLKNKNSQSQTDQRLWWIILILVIVPVILAYPECWLSGWLTIVAIITGIYLALSLKKFRPKSSVPPISPDSFFKDPHPDLSKTSATKPTPDDDEKSPPKW